MFLALLFDFDFFNVFFYVFNEFDGIQVIFL